jgi:hypothetical protein
MTTSNLNPHTSSDSFRLLLIAVSRSSSLRPYTDRLRALLGQIASWSVEQQRMVCRGASRLPVINPEPPGPTQRETYLHRLNSYILRNHLQFHCLG